MDLLTIQNNQRLLHWQFAISLHAMEGLQLSNYVVEIMEQNIKESLSMLDLEEAIYQYYETQNYYSNEEVQKQRRCDLVSARIVRYFEEETFSFNYQELNTIHKYLYHDIYNFAGEYRRYNIGSRHGKKTPQTIVYLTHYEIEDTLLYEFNREQRFHYQEVVLEFQIRNMCDFVSRVWRVHPFSKGNTVTVAIFTKRYLEMKNFILEQVVLIEDAHTFKEALIKTNFEDTNNGVFKSDRALMKFFRKIIKQ